MNNPGFTGNLQLLDSDYDSSTNDSEPSITQETNESRGNFSSNIDNSFQVAELNDRILLLQEKHAQDIQRLSQELDEAKELAKRRKIELNNLVSQFQTQRESMEEKNRIESKELSQLRMAAHSFFAILSAKSSFSIESFDDAVKFVNNLSIDIISKNEKIAQLESKLTSSFENEQENNKSQQKYQEKQIKGKIRKTFEKMQKESDSKISSLMDSIKKLNKKKKQYQKIIKGQSEKILQLQQSIDQMTTPTQTNLSPASLISSTIGDSHPESTISILEAKNAIASTRLENSNNEIRNLTIKINDLEIQNNDLLSTVQKQEKSIDELRSDNEQLTKAFDEISEKYKIASQENQDFKDALISKETEIALLDTNLRETKIEYENLLSKQSLPSNNNNVADDNSDYKNCNLYNDAFSSISTLFENQSNEIQKVHLQRKELICQLQNANDFLGFCDKQIQKLISEKEVILDQKATYEKQTNQQKIQEKNDFLNAFNDVLLLLPQDVAEEVSQYENLELTRSQIFLKTVSKVVDYFSKRKNLNSSENDDLNNENTGNEIDANKCKKLQELRKINATLMSHLSNTNRFLKKLSSTSRSISSNTNLNDDLVGTSRYDFELIRKECARIGSFIDEYEKKVKPENYPSIFDLASFDESTKSLLQFITSTADINEENDNEKEQLNQQGCTASQTPIKELISMFDSVLLTNSILSNQLDESKVTISFLQQNNELHKRESEALSTLQEWKRNHEREIDEIFQQISTLLPIPNPIYSGSSNYSNYNSEDSDQKEAAQNEGPKNTGNVFSEIISQISNSQQEVRNENEKLKSIILELEEKVNHSKNSQKQNNEKFCRKADKIIGTIEQNVIDRNEEYQIIIDGLQESIEKSRQEKEKIVTELTNKIKKLIKKKKLLKEKYDQLFNEKENIKSQLTTEINSLNEEIKKLTEMNDQLNQSNNLLQQNLQHKTAKKLIYKQKYEKLNTQNLQLLKDINQRSEDLAAKYDETISKLENELNETRAKKEEAENEIASYSDYKLNLQRQNASLIISERTLKLKLSSLTEQLENERKGFDMKESSLKMSLQNQLSKETSIVSDELMQLRILISNISEKYLNITIHPSTEIQRLKQIFSNAIEIKFNSKEFRIVNDILKLKEKLNIGENVSIVDFIQELNDKIVAQDKIIQSGNEKNDSLLKENEKLKAECIKTDIFKRENLSWKEWSRSLLRQFYPSTTNESPIETTKSQIEEIMFSSVSQRRLLNKIDLLRKEKILLTTRTQLVLPQKPKTHYNVQSKSSAITIKSIRPILLALACAHRIQNNL